ncbi:DinB family protein [Psychroserpens sp.]|uniref:DinB family protein n=1 Tax=Psychroserpens sp. TaxID=2020870 RepID=UPI001B215A57|nr:DinB family protein [Psychroserpens sp.]MBO6606529.1 DinB family protein [Psychroserpens sp.]MBO6631810.1 DinB family protein [Psychroserpens sp.]MBO6653233.1 DinB family protein [Psychroserpens sp.]MBO6680740.1 DinB family protein [Psychroserpens sp.]MBO6750302.1 DinB family protein [Psychroserpens sp.]
MIAFKDLTKEEYNAYYQTYIDKSGHDNLLDGLKSNLEAILSFYEAIPESKLEYRYEEGKWTVKEIIQHLMDAERVFAYRALRIARQDQTNLPGFEQDDYVVTSKANKRAMRHLLEEYRLIRLSTIMLFESLSEADLALIGQASGSPASPRALGFIIIGHENHHRGVIEQRYL